MLLPLMLLMPILASTTWGTSLDGKEEMSMQAVDSSTLVSATWIRVEQAGGRMSSEI